MCKIEVKGQKTHQIDPNDVKVKAKILDLDVTPESWKKIFIR